jgi:hypothetical protein
MERARKRARIEAKNDTDKIRYNGDDMDSELDGQRTARRSFWY